MKIRKIILSFLLFILINPFLYSEETKQNKNILILYSMTPSTPAYRILTDGIRTKMTEKYKYTYNLYTEYLEKERYPKGDYPKERFDLINEKYEHVNLDLLICIGVDIIETVKKDACEYLKGLPAITIDFDLAVNGFPFDLKLNDRMTVIGMPLEIKKSLDAAFNLFPGRDSVYFICGTSTVDRMYLSVTRAASKNFDPKRTYTFVTDIAMDEALSFVGKLPPGGIIFIPGFNNDSKNVPYYNPESIRLISQVANAPVFSYSDMGLGDGAVGGYLLSFKKISLLAGETAIKILEGTAPSSIIITEKDQCEYLYDWRQLLRWGLTDSDRIPEGSKILFEETSFFDKYRWFIIAAFLFLVVQFLLILNLIRLFRKERMIKMQLIDSENKFRELVSEDRILRVGQLTASLSHELNQPLTAILSTAQAGLRFIDSNNLDPELMKELFGNIVEDDKRTAAILSSIRGMMKLEKREKERIDLNMLIDDILNIYQGELVRNNIQLDKFLADHPVCVIADAVQIKQVLMNLILNAIQSIEKFGGKNRRITVIEEIDEDQVTVFINDNGEGISEHIKDKIFKPFMTSKQKGTGIGLAISWTIINEHQGKIWAENNPGGGAVFAFSLKTC